MHSLGFSLSLLAVWIAVTFRGTEAVRCYQCNANYANFTSGSDVSWACSDPFNSVGSGVTQCTGTTCVKVVVISYSSGQTVAVRLCDSASYSNTCGLTFQSYGAGVGCACQGDLCNMGDKLQSTSIAITTAVAFIASASRIFY